MAGVVGEIKIINNFDQVYYGRIYNRTFDNRKIVEFLENDFEITTFETGEKIV